MIGFGSNGKAKPSHGSQKGLPVCSFTAAFALPNGDCEILYLIKDTDYTDDFIHIKNVLNNLPNRIRALHAN